MKKAHSILIVLLAVFASTIALNSCNDEDPFVKPKLSVETEALTFKESDGEITITFILDKAYDKDIEVEYSLGGTAKDKVTATGTNSNYDYEITSDYLEMDIPKGSTSGTIDIKLYSDLSIEDTETIEISIEAVSDENIEMTTNDEVEITLEQEDGLLVVLEWGTGTGENYTDVDMDLFLWAEDETSTLVLAGIAGTIASTESPEFMFVPVAIMQDGTYGLSCNYYEGTADPMNFDVSFTSVIDGEADLIITKSASYELDNVHPWEYPDDPPLLVMTFDKTGGNFTNFSEITVPTTGSRVGTSKFPEQVVKQPVISQLPSIVSKLLKKR